MEKVAGTYDYARLDASGEGDRAAFRMEARANEPASAAMFEALVRPFLSPEPRRVLEVGAGTGALARRILTATTKTEVVVTDKSEVMLEAARRFLEPAPAGEQARATFVPWDAAAPRPEGASGTFDLVLSSVMVPYLDDMTLRTLLASLRASLAEGGTLVFVEQDLQTNSMHHAHYSEVRDLFVRKGTNEAPFLPFRLRGLLREAGFSVLPRRSFLWTSDSFVPYLRDLIGRACDEAVTAGRLPEARGAKLVGELEHASAQGDFYYGLVYHAIAAKALSPALTLR